MSYKIMQTENNKCFQLEMTEFEQKNIMTYQESS